jgi:NAD(P)-dependent dehydrogenase (short-subunit alcohol dehydrogenase family)
MKEVKGKVAVVTGGASGIGRAMAESFAAVGMRVVLSDIEEPVLAATTKALRSTGADVHSVVTDVSKMDQVEALAAEALRKYGAVHVLCNNAGVGAGVWPGWTTTLDDWQWVLGVNLMGVVHGVRTFLPIMIEQGVEGSRHTWLIPLRWPA